MKDKKLFSWVLYDWGNSAFSTSVMAGFFPVFLKAYWGAGTDPQTTTAQLGLAIGFSSMIMALASPFLGVLSDLRGLKKKLLFIFMVMGALSSVALAFLGQGEWAWALIIYSVAMIGFNASSVFYDSLLPSLAQGHRMDYASSLGYAMGYLGGGLLFLINVIWYLKPELFGFSGGVQAVQASFVSVGIWWFLFTLPLMKNVPEPKFVASTAKGFWNSSLESIQTLQRTLLHILKDKNIAIFLLAYWFFIDGVYTVMTMAVDFGMAIGLESSHLIGALLVTQFVGFPCAYFFGTLTKRWGCRKPILFCLGVYMLTLVFGANMSQSWHFYVLAGLVGSVQGGVQSLSRSLFGKMVPVEKSGEYFAFFNLMGRFAAILGPMLVSLTVLTTGSSRWGLVSIMVLFVLGGGLLLKVRETA
jgi:UMF1 family MFS transporter